MSLIPRTCKIKELAQKLEEHQRWIAVIAPAFSGKSVLAGQLRDYFSRQGKCVLIRFQAEHTVLGNLVDFVRRELANSLDAPPIRGRSLPELLDHVGGTIGRITLLFDELDLLPEGVLSQFASELRRFLNDEHFKESRQAVSGILFGAGRLYYQTSRATSPLANLMEPYYLPDLNAEQTKVLFESVLERSIDESLSAAIFRETAGQPYWTTKLAKFTKTILEEHEAGKNSTTTGAMKLPALRIHGGQFDGDSTLPDLWLNSPGISSDSCLERIEKSLRHEPGIWDAVETLLHGKSINYSAVFHAPLRTNILLCVQHNQVRFRGEIARRLVTNMLGLLERGDLKVLHGEWDSAVRYYRELETQTIQSLREQQASQGLDDLLDLFVSGVSQASFGGTLPETAITIEQMLKFFIGCTEASIWRRDADENSPPTLIQGDGELAEEILVERLPTVTRSIWYQRPLIFEDNRGFTCPLTTRTHSMHWCVELYFEAGLSTTLWPIRLVKVLGPMLAELLESALETDTKTRQFTRRRKLAQELMIRMQRSDSVEALFEEIIRGVQSSLGYECAQLSLAFPDEGVIRAVAANGAFDKILQMTVRPLGGTDILALVLRENEYRVVRDCRTNNHCDQPAIEKAGLLSLLCLPLFNGEAAVGVLQVGNTTRTDEFSRFDVEVLEPFASAAAVALSMAREREWMRSLTEHSRNGIAIVNREGIIQVCNEAYRALTNATIGTPTLLHYQDEPERPLVRAAFDQPGPVKTIRELQGKKIEVTAIATKDSFGTFNGGIEILEGGGVLNGLSDSLIELLKCTDLRSLADGIVECLCVRFGFKRARLYRYKNFQLASYACYGMTSEVTAKFRRGHYELNRSRADRDGDGFECIRLGKALVIVNSSHRPESCAHLNELEIGIDGQHRQVIIRPDKEIHYRDEFGHHELPEWLDIPLIAGNRVWGKISLDTHGADNSATTYDLELVSLFATWVVESLIRYEQTEAMQRQVDFTQDILLGGEGRGLEAIVLDFLINLTINGGPGFNRAAVLLKDPITERISGYLCHGSADRAAWHADIDRMKSVTDRWQFARTAREKILQNRDESRIRAFREFYVDASDPSELFAQTSSSARPTHATAECPVSSAFWIASGWEPAPGGLVFPLLYEEVCEGLVYVDNAFNAQTISTEQLAALEAACRQLAAVAQPIRLATQLSTQVRNVSHNSLTPLSAIAKMAESMLNDDNDQAWNERLQIIAAEARRAGDSFRQTLRSATQTGKLISNRYTFDAVATLCERVAPYLTIMRQYPDAKILIGMLPQSTYLYGDPSQLGDVFAELSANAYQTLAVEEGPRDFTVEAYRENNELVVRFLNSGPTVPTEHRERIFEKHVSHRGGTGIGLWLSRVVVQNHGGRLQYAITKDGRNEFRIYLPLLELTSCP